MKLHPFSIFGPEIFAGVIQDNICETFPFPAQLVNQVHGVEILDVSEYVQASEGYDAMISCFPDLKLMIKTADCIPLMLADEEAGVIAAVHAGWRSLVADIIPKTIAAMIKKGASPSAIKVGMGPSLGTCCSEFSDPKNEIPEAYHWAILENNHVDLLNIAHRQLEDAGITLDRVERFAICTACNPEWFSWRRDHSKERLGTFIERLA
ncbi:MAG: YfiH family protein [Oceanicoccus sp.]|jgi:YfiH family protein